MTKRTVTCGYCGRPGHNKRGCETRLSRIENVRARRPDSFVVRQHDEEVARRKATSTKPRRCTYCGKLGHNKRTCKAMKADIHKLAVLNAEWRRNVVESCVRIGLGIGAMLENRLYKPDIPRSEWPVHHSIVKNLQWEKLNFFNEHAWLLECIPMADFSNTRRMALSHEILQYGAAYEVAVTTSEAVIRASVPKNYFVPDLNWAAEYFKKKSKHDCPDFRPEYGMWTRKDKYGHWESFWKGQAWTANTRLKSPA